MAKKRRKSGGSGGDVAIVDFSKAEESGGSGKRYPEQDYVGRIIEAKMDKSSEKESKCIKLTLAIKEPEKYKGKKVIERMWLSPKALPRLQDFLEILGIKVPKSTVKIPLKKLKGKDIGFSLEDEEYEGKIRSRVSWDWLDPDDVDPDGDDDDDDDDLDLDDDDLDDEDDDDEEEDDDDEDEEDDLDSFDRKELKAYIKEEGLDVKVKKSMDEDDIREAIREEEDDDEDDDDDEDEDELESLDLDDL